MIEESISGYQSREVGLLLQLSAEGIYLLTYLKLKIMTPVYWTMKNGQKINVDDMDTNHLRNTLKLIIRTAEAKALKAKQEPKFKLRGEIAQDHVAQMEDADYCDEMAADFEFWKY